MIEDRDPGDEDDYVRPWRAGWYTQWLGQGGGELTKSLAKKLIRFATAPERSSGYE